MIAKYKSPYVSERDDPFAGATEAPSGGTPPGGPGARIGRTWAVSDGIANGGSGGDGSAERRE